MRIVEGLEGKGFRLPLSKGEVELAEKLAGITIQLKGSAEELSRRVQNLSTASRIHSDGFGGSASMYLPGTGHTPFLQLKGSAGELSRRVQNLSTASCIHSDGFGGSASMYLLGTGQTQEESLADMHQRNIVGYHEGQSRRANLRDLPRVIVRSDNVSRRTQQQSQECLKGDHW